MEKQITKKRKRQFAIIATILGILLTWGVAEIAFRALVYMKAQKYPTQTTEIDDKLGWRAVPNFNFKGTVPEADGSEYQLDFQTDENGFRFFGNANSTEKKLLVFGDSYTHAIEVSKGDTYYGQLQDSLGNVEIFAYGARGIGPLQQKLWLDKWYSKINPDAVLWQFCFNDIFNSSYELEHNSYFNNNRRRRPYWENGEMVYKNPARLGMGGLREFSKFIDFIATKIEVVLEGQDHKNKTASEDLVEQKGRAYEAYQKALNTFDDLVQSIKLVIGKDVPILAFPVEDTQPYVNDITEILKRNGIPVVHHIPQFIQNAQEKGTSVMAKDNAHWNANAHKIASEEIWKYLKPMLFVPDPVELKREGVFENEE